METIRKQIMIASAKAELSQAAQTFLDKVDQLEKLESLTELNTAVYEGTDLCVSDATNVLYYLIEALQN
jgi:hypothetical protein